MSTEAALKTLSNTELASGTEIPATKHRIVNDAIIEELFDAQSRGDVLSAVQAAVAIATGDKVLVIRSGAAYLLDADEFGFISNFVDLDDVNIPTPSNDQVVVYDTATSKFIVKDLADISTGGDITGSGTVNAMPKFSTGTSITDSSISDDGTTVTVSSAMTASGAITGQDLIESQGVFYHRNNILVLNKAVSGWIRWVSRNTDEAETRIDLEQIRNITPASGGGLILGGDTSVTGNLTVPSGAVGGFLSSSLGTNPTALDANSVRTLNVTAATYTASTTLTLSNVTNLFDFTIQLTNTNANVLTFAGVTLHFKSSDLPSGVSFASNALTFPSDSAVKYNLVGIKFDGVTFDCKIEIR